MSDQLPVTSREGLRAWVAAALNCSPQDIGEDDSLIEMGMSSLMIMRLPAMLKKAGISVKLADLLREATLGGWLRLMEGGREYAEEPAVTAATDGQPFALTDMQRAYWMGRQPFFPLGGIAAHGYLEIEATEGGFDPARLEEALNATIAVHSVLRVVLTPDGRQKVLAHVPRYGISRANGPGEREKRRAEMQAEILPAGEWPLFRICLTGSEDSPDRFLHISFDILLFDIASLALWLSQWQELYSGRRRHVSAPGRLFSQYISEVEAGKTGKAAAEHKTWWSGRAAAMPRAPQLPLARQPREVTPPTILRMESFVEAKDWGLLKAHAAKTGVTPAGLFTAMLAVALSRFSRKPEMTINLTLFDRSGERARYDGVLGDFTSMLPVVVRTGGGQDFAALCRAVYAEIIQALSHAGTSGAEVNLEIARAHGITNENPLPVVLTCAAGSGVDSYLDVASRFGRLVFARNQAPQTWIDVQAVDFRGGVSIIWDYVDGLFPEGFLAGVFEFFLQLARELTRDDAWYCPAQSLCLKRREAAVLELLPGADRNLVEPFLKSAARTPHAPALVTPERTVTYAELERASRMLAHRLATSGLARNGGLLGIALPRGWWQVAAVLAVLRAGAAYLPVNVSDPADRVATIFEEGRVDAVLCDAERALELPEALKKIVVSTAFPGEEALPDTTLLPADPAEVAYVIFTSGSTGKPKGVAVSHKAALNTILDVNSRNGVGPEDRLFAASQLNFDLSVYDIFGALAAGACLVIPPHATLPDPHEWARLVTREGVTVWNSVPALAQLLLEAARASGISLESLRLFMLSGDWLPVELARDILALPQKPGLISMGGATEAAIWSVEKVVKGVALGQKTVPYGKALSGQALYVLDTEMRPCPQWTPGEIHIAGVGLAECYLHRPELTASAFVRHPESGERLYRTGDWGRLLPDGDIEFLGREDTQVKINGMRIELGEIEAATVGISGVRQAVAVIAHDEGVHKIVLYAVPRIGQNLDASAMRDALKKKLPASWLPAAICIESALPLSVNGKIDRRALTSRAGDALRTAQRDDAAIPETQGQKMIADIWAAVLNGVRPGVAVSFFEAGGTSFLAIQLAAKLTKALKRPVPVVSVFQYTTIASQAKHFLESEAFRPEDAERGRLRSQKLGALTARARQRRSA